MSTRFVFVNTGGPGPLDVSASKQMRAHVTKMNFARRRRRLVQAYQGEKSTQESPDQQKDDDASHHSVIVRSQGSGLAPTSTTISRDPFSVVPDYLDTCIRYILHRFSPFIFPSASVTEKPLETSDWTGLLLGEPALVEAALAVGLKHHPGPQVRQESARANSHLSRALKLINQRLGDVSRGLSDGLLAAVFMLSFGEKISNNIIAWRIHTDGLTQMMRLRQAHGQEAIPDWLYDFLVFNLVDDSIVTLKPRHQDLFRAFQSDNDNVLSCLSYTRQGTTELRQTLERLHSETGNRDQLEQDVNQQVDILHTKIVPLLEEGSSIRCLAKAFLVYLNLMWPRPDSTSLQDLAEDLRLDLVSTDHRICACVDGTVWQLFMGGMAAELWSTRGWYIRMLHGILSPLQLLDWQQIPKLLSREYMVHSGLIPRAQEVFDQVMEFDKRESRSKTEFPGYGMTSTSKEHGVVTITWEPTASASDFAA